VANPLRIWLIAESSARLGDFWIPQRGVFTAGRIFFAAS